MVALIQLFQESDLTELSVEQQGRRLFLRKGDVPTQAVEETEAADRTPRELAIKAHMVGTFHWTKDKADKAGVVSQQHVEKGQLVGYIEAMDIFNEVEAPEAGEVAEIAVSAGQPVEYGQTLITLAPEGS